MLTEQLKQQWLEELKELGLSNKKGEKSFTFDFVKKSCEELNICNFKKIKANKKDCKENNNLIYRKEYLKITLLGGIQGG